jgi:serine/threonine protein kinase
MNSAKALESRPPAAMGKYVPFARIGKGGMADVFLAVARGPVGFNKLSVVKKLRNAFDDAHVQMFHDEARLSARLSHPNVVNTYEVGEAAGVFYIAMEYLEGQPLQALLTSFIERGDGLSETLAAFIAVQALKGLHYAHELADYDGTPLRVVHRDVSPHNLFITYAGEIKLLDFGIAKASMSSTRTETGVLKGKVRYMAPEQFGERNIDRRADVCAFGIILWEMLARRPLYQGDAISILTEITTQTPPTVRSIRPEISAELDAIVAKALCRDPNERYASAEAMRIDLEQFLRGKQDGTSDSMLARLMNDSFAAARDEVRARIKGFVAALPTTDAGSPSSPNIVVAADLLPSLFGDGSGPRASPLTTSSAIALTGPGVKPPATRASWRWIAAGALALAVVGGGVLALRRSAARHVAQAPAQVSVPTVAHVRISTIPAGALVQWSDTSVARTPAELTLEAGTRRLVITDDGYEPEQLTLDVQAGVAIDRTLVLRPKLAPAPMALPTTEPAARPAPPSVNNRFARPAATVVPTPARPATPAPPAATATTAPPAKIRVLDDSK